MTKTQEDKIQRVREITGHGILSSRKALEEKDWNIEEAVKRLGEHDRMCMVNIRAH
jgi:translation elongation factor EF-Ts